MKARDFWNQEAIFSVRKMPSIVWEMFLGPPSATRLASLVQGPSACTEKILTTFEKRQTDDLSDMEQILNALDKMPRE
jgi:hypothetical protein